MSITTINKNSKNLTRASEMPSSIFIDNSGSTSNTISNMRVLDIEKKFAETFKTNSSSYISWNSSANLEKNLTSINSSGGTSPSSIFTNPATNKAYLNSKLVVFITDGEIDNKEVESFSKNIGNSSIKPLVICCLVNNTSDNISVFAPLMNSINVVVLKYVDSTSKDSVVLFSKIPSLEKGSRVNLSKLLELTVNDVYSTISSDNYILEETATSIKYILFSDILDNKLPREEYSKINWESLCQRSKVVNQISKLRLLVNRLKQEEISELRSEVEVHMSNLPQNKVKQELIKQINDKILNKEDHTQLSLQLRSLLREELGSNSSREELVLKEKFDLVRSKWDKVKAILSHYETTDYSLNNYVYSSNRVNRAATLKEDEDGEFNIFTNICYKDTIPTIDCSICMDKGPLVLWITPPSNEVKDVLYSDYTINFPLINSDIFSKLIVPNPVCGHCAEDYYKASKQSVYRVDLSGYIPINWRDNKHLINKMLFTSITEGKILPHIKLALFAYLDQVDLSKYSWIATDIDKFKNYFLEEMLHSIYTTDSFSDEGGKVSLFNAIEKFPPPSSSSDDYLLRQPLDAVLRIFKYKSKLFNSNEEIINSMLRKRFLYYFVERFSMATKNKDITLVKDRINSLLFNTWCGLPKLTEVADVKLVTFEDLLKDSIIGCPDTSSSSSSSKMSSKINSLIPALEINNLLFFMRSLEYDRPLTLYNKYDFKQLPSKDIYLRVAGERSKHNLKRNPNNYSPCYSTYNSINSCASKFYYNAEYLGLDKTNTELQILISKYLIEEYGSSVPDKISYHINIHKLVANIIDTKYYDCRDFTLEMLLDVNEKVKSLGSKGNIYYSKLNEKIVYVIHDFLRVRNEYNKLTTKYKIDTSSSSSNFAKKADLEREHRVGFDGKIIYPGMLEERHCNLAGLIPGILEDAQKLYTSRASSVSEAKNKEVISLFIQEEFSIIVPNHDLVKWEQEQLKIQKEITLVDSTNFDNIKYIAGCDVSFSEDDKDKAVASLVIFENKSYNKVAEISIKCRTNIPYVPHFLAFREVPVLIKLLEKVKEEMPQLVPELILFDGNGVWHPRGVGIASHFSVLSGIACIGVAKKVLYVENITREEVVKQQEDANSKEMDMVDIKTSSGLVVGTAFNTTGFVKNSSYISVGSGISLETSKRIILSLGKKYGHKVVEPIREADLLSRRMVGK